MHNELMIRLGVFLALFFILACLESVFPKRKRVQPRKDRWVTNWTLVIIDTLCLRVVAIVVPFVATLAAFDAALNKLRILLPPEFELLLLVNLIIRAAKPLKAARTMKANLTCATS